MNKGCSAGFCFEDTLDYIGPSSGSWGLAKTLCLVPDLQILFVTPEGCGRHSSLVAIQDGNKDRIFYYYASKEEITAGYDEEIKDAVRQVFDRQGFMPAAFIILVGCIDDLMGTDNEAIAYELEDEFPQVKFRFCHMNPIRADTNRAPMVTTQERLFSLLDKNPNRDTGVNLIGCFEKPDQEGDLYKFLYNLGVEEVRHISDYRTFEDFQDMAKSQVNILMHPNGRFACEKMKENLHIDFVYIPPSYKLDTISSQYESLFKVLSKGVLSRPDLSAYRNLALEEIEKTLNAIKDRPIWISDGSILKPYELGVALVQYGFNVDKIVARSVPSYEEDSSRYLSENTKVSIIQARHSNTILFENQNNQALCIGFNAAYIAKSSYVAPIINDQYNFGYHGTYRLMSAMSQAIKEKGNLEKLIEASGVVI